MDYKYTDIAVDDNDFDLKDSAKINPCLLKNNKKDIIKALEFFNTDEKFLYVHGFLGTGKRQFVNYVCEYLSKDVIKLEYYCKEATVCDDILLLFTDIIEKMSTTKTLSLNAKITTLSTKFQKMLNTTKRPFLIVLHSLDNISDENSELVIRTFERFLKETNVKIIATTRALKTNLFEEEAESRKVFLKAFSKDIFKEFMNLYGINASEKQMEDFYALTRGYYFYSALSAKLIQALGVSVPEFIEKFKVTENSFDTVIGELYINLIPQAVKNFFWFLRAIRHGISLNALAIFEIYDEFSIQYLQTNMIAFQDNEIIYLQDYFAQKIEMKLPEKTAIKLHKYIMGIYENQLKESLENRDIFISRQSLRAEIEYHAKCIENMSNKEEFFETGEQEIIPEPEQNQDSINQTTTQNIYSNATSITDKINIAKQFKTEKKYTESVEIYKNVLDDANLDLSTLMDVRLELARIYNLIGNYAAALHYFELVETYYKSNKELINLNYLHYEMANLYCKMYKNERAVETIKKVIYSVDAPQSLMVKACMQLGNIYSDMNNPSEAYVYYKKAIESLDENIEVSVLSELYFKYALANDDKGDISTAFDYYNKCISITGNNNYLASAYSNLASCYYESGNDDEALNCFKKSYSIEKANNNYDGIYYAALKIAKILSAKRDEEALKFLLEAKQSAEFINESIYIIEAYTALGDYYYNIKANGKDALKEYCRVKRLILDSEASVNINKIQQRIDDMQKRLPKNDFMEIVKKYEL